MKNTWLVSNEPVLNTIKRLLVELEYLPIFQDYPVRVIHGLLTGAEAEVSRLQEEVNKLSLENSKMREEIEKNKKSDEVKTT